MRKRDNFYFYFSLILLFFCIMLIFFFYEKQYNFNDFIDVKTIITSLGTLFGAYFGAKIAGKYAVHSIEKQIEYERQKQLVDLHDNHAKFVIDFLISIEFIADVFGILIELITKIRRTESTDYTQSIEIINALIRKIEEHKNKLVENNIDVLPNDFNMDLRKVLSFLDLTKLELKSFLKVIDNRDHYYDDIGDVIDSRIESMKSTLVKLNEHTAKLREKQDESIKIISNRK